VSVLIAFPSGENVNVQFMLSTIQLLMFNKTIPIANIANCCSSRIAFNRNTLVDSAKAVNATHILFIDADMIFPANALERLMAHDLDIVGATACKRTDDEDGNDAIGWPMDEQRMQIQNAPIKMRIMGLPFMLIKMSVFEKLPAPWFAEPPQNMMGKLDDPGLMPEDEFFCHNAIKAGFDIWCDISLSMDIGHRGAKTFYIMKPTAV
jgi:hypothetical protein